MRDAQTIVFASSTRLEVELERNGALRRVGYKCDQPPATDDPSNPHDQTYLRCVRVEGPAGAALPSYATGRTVIAEGARRHGLHLLARRVQPDLRDHHAEGSLPRASARSPTATTSS